MRWNKKCPDCGASLRSKECEYCGYVVFEPEKSEVPEKMDKSIIDQLFESDDFSRDLNKYAKNPDFLKEIEDAKELIEKSPRRKRQYDKSLKQFDRLLKKNKGKLNR